MLAPIINPVYVSTVTNSVYANAVCFSFEYGDFPSLKQSSSDVSKGNIQSLIVRKAFL